MPSYPFSSTSDCVTCASPGRIARSLVPTSGCSDLVQADDLNFLLLTDTPDAFGTTGQMLAVNADGDGLDFVAPPVGGGGGTGATTIIGLTDVTGPMGATGQVLAVDAAGGALEFVAPPVAYMLPAATTAMLGGVKVGANLSVAADGTLSVALPPSMVYRGVADARNAYPAGYVPANGDMWIVSDAGTAHADWVGLTTAVRHEMVVFDGARWAVAGDVGSSPKPDWNAAPGSVDEILNKPAAPLTKTQALVVPRIASPAPSWTSAAISVAGAAMGALVRVSLDVDQAGAVVSAYVSAVGQVRIAILNLTGIAITLGSCNARIEVTP